MDDKKKKQKDEEDVQVEEPVVDEVEEPKAEKVEEEVGDGLETQIQGLEDQLKRAVADYRNLENRIREEKLEYVRFANKNLLEGLLPAFDTLFLAAKYTEDESVKLTAKHILNVLASSGVVKIETEGQKYDPATMEAIEVVEGDEGMVVEETQPGFLLNGKVLRPARVKVGGKKD